MYIGIDDHGNAIFLLATCSSLGERLISTNDSSEALSCNIHKYLPILLARVNHVVILILVHVIMQDLLIPEKTTQQKRFSLD